MGKIKNISELARLAGVSAGTVSRALANSSLISQGTRDRIQALAREHDFRLNSVARNLRTRRTGAIGVVVPLGHDVSQHISDPFFMAMLGHLADALTGRGYDLLLSRVIPDGPAWLDRIVGAGRVDGIILIGQSDQGDIIDQVAANYRPLVVWGAIRQYQVHCSVGTDNVAGGTMAAEHLIERGCTRLAFLGDPRAIEIEQRLTGCRRAMASRGIGDGPEVFATHFAAQESEPEIARALDAIGSGFDGIISASDVIAMTALRALAERGIAVPGTIRVIGFDDLPLAQQTVPRLTTIRQDLKKGSDHLVDLLFRRIAGETPASIVMPPELVIRTST